MTGLLGASDSPSQVLASVRKALANRERGMSATGRSLPIIKAATTSAMQGKQKSEDAEMKTALRKRAGRWTHGEPSSPTR